MGSRTRIVLLAGIALACPSTSRAGLPLGLFVRPKVGLFAGTSSYHLELTAYEPSIKRVITASSELVWPMSSLLAGLELGFARDLPRGRRITIALSGATNLLDPWGTMDDSDYLASGLTKIKFSYTESKTQGRVLLADLGARLTLWRWRKERRDLGLDLRLGYRHLFLSSSAWGAEGWQLNGQARQVPVSIEPGTRGIDYVTHRFLPYVGAGLEARLGERFTLEPELRLLMAFARNHDDHVLRNKEGKAFTAGLGVLLGVSPRFLLARSASGAVSVSVGADVELVYLGAWGTLKQDYYGDDPFLSGDQTGTPIPDSDFRTTSLTASLMALGEVTF